MDECMKTLLWTATTKAKKKKGIFVYLLEVVLLLTASQTPSKSRQTPEATDRRWSLNFYISATPHLDVESHSRQRRLAAI